MNKRFALASMGADTAVCVALLAAVGVALLAGKDDIRRFWRMYRM